MHVSDSLSHSNGTYSPHKHLFHISVVGFRHCTSVTLHEQELGSSKHMCLLSPSEGMEEMRYDEWAVKRHYWSAYVSHYVCTLLNNALLYTSPKLWGSGQFFHPLLFLLTDGDGTCCGVWAGFFSGTLCPSAVSRPCHSQWLQHPEKTWWAPWKNDNGTAGCNRGWGAPWQNGTLHQRFKSTTP